ncbi:ASCH domain-containing protein [Algoriphagus chordae]|uniref:Putative transcriptional regulator n=1 Tax=Algoriphagus chordae TaxID=237019 RepID=A0A2W7QWA6_9BACT|nr:ASCH domain-containing protein [Algoriphagus chordae]PZX52564.1 putative transcriptional regulator [Algoriphagus chordae]
MSKLILVSIKPEFVEKIFDGTKKIELRKVSPHVEPGDLMIVYSTSPEMAIVGVCQIEKVIRSTPKEIWNSHSEVLGIDETRFFDYYSESSRAVGIVINSAKRLKSKISLESIKRKFPRFAPPQTYKYYSKDVIFNLYPQDYSYLSS